MTKQTNVDALNSQHAHRKSVFICIHTCINIATFNIVRSLCTSVFANKQTAFPFLILLSCVDFKINSLKFLFVRLLLSFVSFVRLRKPWRKCGSDSIHIDIRIKLIQKIYSFELCIFQPYTLVHASAYTHALHSVATEF